MADLLFWFLVSQTIAGLPDMSTGTEVRVVSSDLLTIYASAQVEDGWLTLEGDIHADSEVHILIMQPSSSEASAESASDLETKALSAHISPDGKDILLQFKELDGPLSFKKWLKEERGTTLAMPPKAGE